MKSSTIVACLLQALFCLTVSADIAESQSHSDHALETVQEARHSALHHHDPNPDVTANAHSEIHGHYGISRPDDHAPISIGSSHTHNTGEWMIHYRYMNMEMDGMRKGGSGVSFGDVFAGGPYAVTPTSMTHEMHMLGLMYAVTDRVTLMAMGNYQSLAMDHLISPTAPPPLVAANNGQRTFTTKTEGFGDTKLTAIISIFEERGMQLMTGMGVSLPTGSITEKDERPVPGQPLRDRVLPASMQLGSGTFDWHPSLTWVHQFDKFSYGSQVSGVVRFYDNHEGYQLGNEFAANIWGQYNLADWVSLNGGFGYRWVGDLEGRQDRVGQFTPVPGLRTIPTAWGENYGFQQVDAMMGINFLMPRGFFRNHRIAIDARLPVYRHHSGYRLETDYTVTVGWEWAF